MPDLHFLALDRLEIHHNVVAVLEKDPPAIRVAMTVGVDCPPQLAVLVVPEVLDNFVQCCRVA